MQVWEEFLLGYPWILLVGGAVKEEKWRGCCKGQVKLKLWQSLHTWMIWLVTARSRCGWSKIWECVEILIGKMFPVMLKGKAYKKCVKPALLCGNEHSAPVYLLILSLGNSYWVCTSTVLWYCEPLKLDVWSRMKCEFFVRVRGVCLWIFRSHQKSNVSCLFRIQEYEMQKRLLIMPMQYLSHM